MVVTNTTVLLSVCRQSLAAGLFTFLLACGISHRDLGRTLFFSILGSIPLVAYIAIRGLGSVPAGLIFSLLFWLGMQLPVFAFLFFRRVHRHHRFLHKIAGDDPELKLVARTKSVDFGSTFNDYYQDLLPTAAALAGRSVHEFPASKIQVVHPSPDNPYPNAIGSLDSHTITVNTAMAQYVWHMSKILATRIVSEGTDTGSTLSLEQSIEYIRQLINGYYCDSLGPPILPAFELHADQVGFAGRMVTTIERFIVAHELGHLLVEMASEPVAFIISPARDLAARAYRDFVKTRPTAADCDETIEAWALELGADMAGMHLCLHSLPRETSPERDDLQRNMACTCWAVPLYFRYEQLLETFYEREFKLGFPYTSHPPAMARYASVREMTSSCPEIVEDVSTIETMVHFDSLFDEILRAI